MNDLGARGTSQPVVRSQSRLTMGERDASCIRPSNPMQESLSRSTDLARTRTMPKKYGVTNASTLTFRLTSTSGLGLVEKFY
nr:hypothetical protein CFP56_69561 [Quercus suber]